jgi:hypothetical protein
VNNEIYGLIYPEYSKAYIRTTERISSPGLVNTFFLSEIVIIVQDLHKPFREWACLKDCK